MSDSEDIETIHRALTLARIGHSTVKEICVEYGIKPAKLYRWRRLMTEGGTIAVQADDDVVAVGEVKRLQQQVRELERQLGRKTMEAEILKEALAKAQSKKPSLHALSPWKDDGR